MQNEVRVGDVVAWKDVSDGVLVRTEAGAFYVERGAWRYRVHSARANFWARENAGHPERARNTSEQVTIVATGLTGQETAADLQRLAEVFEVREAIERALDADDAEWFWSCDAERGRDSRHAVIIELADDSRTVAADEATRDDALQSAAERLHAAGWRPGMTAEDAARLLAEAGR